MNLFEKIPSEIINHYILPFIPCMNLTKEILLLQKKKIKLIKYLRKISLTEFRKIKNDILQNYKGDIEYTFEEKNHYLYINLTEKYDYIYIIN